MISVSNENRMAYTEVYTILNSLSEKEKVQLPNNLISQLEKNMDSNYHFKFNISAPLECQNISKKAKIILAVIYRDYLASEKQKNKIRAFEKAKKVQINEEARNRYNPDKIFENKITKEEEKNNVIRQEAGKIKEQQTSILAISNEKWYKKIIQKILSFLKKK
ncbi:MAG: hypothetical protein IJ629_05965 [Clostridia bacterium]|nr:hypothetical protein [Clostridia bacterium]